jgi:hypothetical protein
VTFSDIANLALQEIRAKSKLRLYQTDFQCWKWDVLGFRTYEKMQHIGDTALFGDKKRTMVKSANGTAKSFEVSLMVAWSASVFEPGETVSILSAPSVPQLEKVIFKYLKSHYNRALDRNIKLPGRIDESLGWVYDSAAGKGWLAFGRKPPEQDAVSVFQGVRSEFGRTNVFFDEAGGMSRQMFTAAEAVLTGADALFVGIGNPDNTGTEFQKAYTDPKLAEEYNLFTISAFDLPTLTGERVYPHTTEGDEMEVKMLASLTQRKWVEHKQRIWGESDARYLSKVLGEFPPDSGSTFFGQTVINRAHDTEIEHDDAIRPILGADIARYGQDESVVYENRGGRIRLVDSWGKTDTVETARRIHRFANERAAVEVRIDSAGVGGGVFDMLEKLPEFADKVYLLIGVDGGSASPDNSRWANSRAYNHDSLRTQMMEGQIDLDFDDEELKEQLLNVTYKFNTRGAVQITPKDELRTLLDGSPDRLDACIYSAIDLEWLTGNPLAGLQRGSRVSFDTEAPEDDPLRELVYGAGMPW